MRLGPKFKEQKLGQHNRSKLKVVLALQNFRGLIIIICFK